jgi:crotonobetaine/carnitine-CoA ligase
LSHGYYLQQGHSYAEYFGICPNDRVFNPLPLYHANPQVYLVMGALSADATLITARRFSASAFWDQVSEHRATVAILHMAPVEFLKKQPHRDNERKHTLRWTFIPDRTLMERFDIKVGCGGYGLTEAALVFYKRFHLPLLGKATNVQRLFSLCGKFSPNFDVALFDEKDRPVKAGEIGEIVIRPKRAHVMFDGYYGRPDKTVESWRNLWFHTGDLGFLDEDGDLNFVRRASESINVKGEWVDVVGLEDLIRAHPKVVDVAVVGVPDPTVGKEVKACVQPCEGLAIEPEEIIAHCEGRIAHFMIPRFIEFMEQLPRLGGTEKVAKSAMEKAGVTDQTWDREKAGYRLRRL